LVIFINVVSRYFFYRAYPWVEEFSLFTMIWTAGIGARPALKSGDFIKFSFLEEKIYKVNIKLYYLLIIIILLLMLLFLFYTFIFGIQLSISVYRQLSPMLRIPMSIPYAAIPFGSFIMLLTIIEKLLSLFKEMKSYVNTNLRWDS